MEIDDIEYYEYDCPEYCTPDGCKGHTTDIPVGIMINGIMFYVEGYESGDYPNRGDDEKIKKVQAVIEELKKLEKENSK